MHIPVLVQTPCLLLRHDHVFVVFGLIHQVIGSGYCQFDFLTLAENAADADRNLQLGVARNISLMNTVLDHLKLFIENFLTDIWHNQKKLVTAEADQTIGFAGMFPDHIGHGAQRHIPRIVSIGVIV